jgi:dTDP-4-dehydrorhamnose 3,5-epimerase
MIFRETGLSGNYLIDLDSKIDERGFFARFFCANEFSSLGLNINWVQVNTSLSENIGTLRGLHFQSHPSEEIKLIRCIRGEIWDVVVDLRKNSNTFGMWFGDYLSEDNRTMMYVPKGFAHGFISTRPNSEIIYLVSEFYSPTSEKVLLWNDSDVGINWPIQPIMISNKDVAGDLLKDLI